MFRLSQNVTMTAETPATRWLFAQYMTWQSAEGARKTLTEFAEHLGVSRVALNRWMSGARPVSPEAAHVIAAKLGPDIYDVLGMPRPDPLAQAVIAHWGKLSAEQLETLREWVEMLGVRIEARSDPEHGRIKVSEGTATRQARRQRIKT